jgi:ABC-type transporter Mla subunit MlaD
VRVPIYPKQIRELASDGVDTAQRIVSAAPKIAALLDAGESLLDRVARLVARIDQTRASAQVLIDQVDVTQNLARSVVDQAGVTAARLTDLLDQYEPVLQALDPAIARMSETVTSSDIDALLALVRRGPRLTEQVADDVLPVLDSLKTVAPDLTELLAVSRALNEILGSVPGLGRAKKRADDELEQSD